jgi:hypothetical protein
VRRPCQFRSSFALEELDAQLDDGKSLKLMFKDMSIKGLSDKARKVKPHFLYDPVREIDTYRLLLSRGDLGTAAFYGATVDRERERYWLFMENVAAVALWQVGALDTWRQAARWLAGMHVRFAGRIDGSAPTDHLLRYDADFYRLWPQRAQFFVYRPRGSRGRSARHALEWLASRYDQVVERLTVLPVTFIHGEFYASNVLIGEQHERPRVCPIDWEIAAVGPALIDLAALTAGRWEEDVRESLADAYRAELSELDGFDVAPDGFEPALDCCRLHLAVQWLGWAPDWSPPRAHRQNWLAEAVRLAEKLGL